MVGDIAKLVFLLILYLLFIGSRLENLFFNPVMTIFLVILSGVFTNRRVLKGNSFIILIIVLAGDFITVKFLANAFYSGSLDISRDYHIIGMLSLCAFVMSFIPKTAMNQFEKSGLLSLHKPLLNLINTYKFFNFLTFTVLKNFDAQGRTLRGVQFVDKEKIAMYFLIDFVILNIGFLIRTIFKIITSKKKRGAFIRALVYVLLLNVFIHVVLYFNFNSGFESWCREVSKLLPENIGVVLYNMVSEDREKRFKIAIFFLFNYFV